MSISDIFNKEAWDEYDLLLSLNKNKSENIFSLFKKVLYVLNRKSKEINAKSNILSKKIRYYDDKVYSLDEISLADYNVHDVKVLDFFDIKNHSETISKIKTRMLDEFNGIQLAIKPDCWDSNMTQFSDAVFASDYILQLREKYSLKIQNAYFLYDTWSGKTYAHNWHHDDVGFRLKLWIILESTGEVGLYWSPFNFSTTKERNFGKKLEIYSDKPKGAVFLPSNTGLMYLLNTDVLHCGYITENASRLAFVVELINGEKMSDINGLSDACHYNKITYSWG